MFLCHHEHLYEVGKEFEPEPTNVKTATLQEI